MFRSPILASRWVAVFVLLLIAAHLGAQEGSSLAINEIVASNTAAGQDPQGQYDDWVEIYNYGDAPVDLAGMDLTDDSDEPTKWQVPADQPALTTVAPYGYVVIWADGDTDDEGLHAGFKLDAEGEDVALFDVDGATLIDAASVPALVADLSYGRYPDGQEQWQFFEEPTPGQANEGAYDGLVEPVEFSHQRGFYEDNFTVTLSAETPETTIYYALDGEEPGQPGTRFITGLVCKGPIEISRTTCLRAIARRDGWKSSPIGTQTINLNLVRFSDGIDFVFPSFELAPGAYCLVMDDKSVFEAYYGPGLPIAGQYAGNLANGGETIELVDAMGTTIQRFAYEDDWYAETDSAGYSLTMVDVTEPDLSVWSQKEA